MSGKRPAASARIASQSGTSASIVLVLGRWMVHLRRARRLPRGTWRQPATPARCGLSANARWKPLASVRDVAQVFEDQRSLLLGFDHAEPVGKNVLQLGSPYTAISRARCCWFQPRLLTRRAWAVGFAFGDDPWDQGLPDSRADSL